jgi:hypothetical protein
LAGLGCGGVADGEMGDPRKQMAAAVACVFLPRLDLAQARVFLSLDGPLCFCVLRV